MKIKIQKYKLIKIAIILIFLCLLTFFFQKNKQGYFQPKLCLFDSNCVIDTRNISSARLHGDVFGSPPCYKFRCHYPQTSNEWIDYCNHKNPELETIYPHISNCYYDAARFALKKDSEGNNKWREAFEICKKYNVTPEAEEYCKNSMCSNLNFSTQREKDLNILCSQEARVVSTCNDGIKNGREIDIDCGMDCKKCQNGQECWEDEDCESNDCGDRKCYDPCPDGLIENNIPCNCRVSFYTTRQAKDYYCCNGKRQKKPCN